MTKMTETKVNFVPSNEGVSYVYYDSYECNLLRSKTFGAKICMEKFGKISLPFMYYKNAVHHILRFFTSALRFLFLPSLSDASSSAAMASSSSSSQSIPSSSLSSSSLTSSSAESTKDSVSLSSSDSDSSSESDGSKSDSLSAPPHTRLNIIYLIV